MKKNHFILFIFLWSAFLGVKGQNLASDYWLNFSPQKRSTLTKAEVKKIDHLINEGLYSAYWIVEPQAIEKAVRKNILSVNLPGKKKAEKFIQQWTGDNGSGQIVWEGQTKSRDAYATLLTDENAIFGHIKSQGEDFMLYTMEESHTQVLFKKTKLLIPPGTKTCGNEFTANLEEKPSPKEPSPKEPPHQKRFGATGNCDVRALIVFTEAAENAEPNVAQLALTAVAQTNTAFRNSQITENNATLIAAAVMELDPLPNNWTGGAGTGSDRDNIGNDVNVLSTHPETNFNRGWARADIVVCLTPPSYGGYLGIVEGFTGAASAFSIVTTSTAVSLNTFAHEVGHLFDARHQNDDGGMPYANAHSFSYWFTSFKTIMYSPAGGNRILNFSNPNVNFLGKATGTATRDNARRIRERACVVANYDMVSNPPLFGTISGVGAGYPGDELTFQADVSGGGPGPYTYEWRISNSNTPGGPILSSTFELETTLPNNPNSTIFVHMQVSSADGQVRTAVQPVNVQGSGGPPPPSGFKVDGLSKLKLYPNPTRDNVIFSLEGVAEGNAKILLYNSLGKLVQEEEFHHRSGDVQYKSNIEHLAAGMYIAKIKIGSQILTAKLIKEE